MFKKLNSGFTRTPKFGVSLHGKRGFTLIELLVVIAIIGVLSSVVLASLNTARNKGANSAIKANMASFRSQAEISYDSISTINSYAAPHVCNNNTSGGPRIKTAITDTGVTCDCLPTASAWALLCGLKVAENGNNYWCVDSTGTSKGTNTSSLGGAAVCPTP